MKLSRLNTGGEVSNKKKGHKLMSALSHVVCKESSERAYFNFIEEMTKTERKFKLQLYPQVAISMLLPVILILSAVNFNFDYKVIHEEIAKGGIYYFIYLDAILGIEALLLITKSERYMANWFYNILPIASPKPLYKAMLKVVLIKYVMPIIVVHELMLLPITGLKALPVFVVILLNSILMCLLTFKLLDKKLPFTEPFNANDSSAAGTTMGVMFLIAIIGFAHYGCRNMPHSHLIIGAISLILSLILWQISFPKSWEQKLN